MSPAERLDLHARYVVLNDALLNSLGKAPAGIKAALNLQGFNVGVPRDHVAPLTEDETAKLRKIMIYTAVLDQELAKTA